MKKDKAGAKKSTKKAGRPKTTVIDIDFANRDNVAKSLKLNTKLSDKDALLIASILIETKQLLVKQWPKIKDIRDEHFDGKIKFNLPVALDCTSEPENIKVKLAVPRPALKDSAETTTEDPDQLTIDTVSDTTRVGGPGGVVQSPGEGDHSGN